MVFKLGEKELNLTFGMHVSEMLMVEAINETAKGSQSKLQNTAYFAATIVFLGHQNWCLGHDAEPLVTRGEIYQHIDENSDSEEFALELQKVLVEYNNSRAAKKINDATEQLKKKLIEIQQESGKKSEPLPSEY
jgi:hypothetical protein